MALHPCPASVFPEFELQANNLMFKAGGCIHFLCCGDICVLYWCFWKMDEDRDAGAGICRGVPGETSGAEGLLPDVFDAMDHGTRCGCRSCGWGAPKGMETYLAAVGLDFHDYLLEPMPSMNFDGLVAQTPLCTLDKPRLIRDLTRDTGVIKRNLGPEEAEDYDI